MAARTFGERLRGLREDQGWTQKELARAADLTLSAIAKYEQNLREPTWSAAVQLAKALGVEVGAFVIDEAPPTSSAEQALPKSRRKGR
jgi:transcriptional regulator with XRE-family HTH domain